MVSTTGKIITAGPPIARFVAALFLALRRLQKYNARPIVKNVATLFLFAGLASCVVHAETTSTATPSTDQAQAGGTLPNVIFSTDMWGDIDDALALAMLHALHDRHELNLVGVTISNDDKWCASYVDLVNTFYGHPDIPVGLIRGGVNYERSATREREGLKNYTRMLSELKKPDGSYVYPHRLIDGAKAPEAVGLLRKILATQPDGSVVMIQTGYSTNFARLLQSAADSNSAMNGRDLINKKVRLLSVMGGSFDGEGRGEPDDNLAFDTPSSQRIFAEWPTPIVVSGEEIGAAML